MIDWGEILIGFSIIWVAFLLYLMWDSRTK